MRLEIVLSSYEVRLFTLMSQPSLTPIALDPAAWSVAQCFKLTL